MQTMVKPIYEVVPGWNSNTSGIRDLKDLPEKAIQYIKRIEELVGIKVSIISTSPERDDSIFVE